MKGMVYRSYVRSTMLYGRETWCLREIEKDRESNGESESNVWCNLTDGEKEERGPNEDVEIEGNNGLDGKANGVRWYGHVFRRDDGYILRKALEFEVKGKRERG